MTLGMSGRSACRLACLGLALLLAAPATGRAQGRDLGACPEVVQALNPADPMHPRAANVPVARTLAEACGAPGSPGRQLALALFASVMEQDTAVLAAVAPVLAADPDNRHARRFRCHALASLGRAADGLPDCDAALATAPTWAPGHHSRGWALWRLGRLPDAIAALRRATELQPGYAYSWHNLAVFQAEAGQQREAIEGFRQARRLLPSDSLAWRSIGEMLMTLREYDAAAMTYDSVLAAHPGYAAAIHERGEVEWRRSAPELARPFAERAVAVDPRFAPARVLRGDLRYIDGQVDSALADFRAAAAADTVWAIPHQRIARLLRQQRRCAEAQPALVEAFVRAPEWTTLADELQGCHAEWRGMLPTMAAVLDRRASLQLLALRARLPDSVRTPAEQLADWSALLQQTSDSTARPALEALRESGVRLYRLGQHAAALRAFLALQRLTTGGVAAELWPLRQVALGAEVLLRAELGEVEAARAALAAADREDEGRFRARDEERRTLGRPVMLRRPTSVRAAEQAVAEAWALRVGLRLLDAGDVRGAELIMAADESALNDSVGVVVVDLLRRGRPAPDALLAYILAKADWTDEGSLAVRAEDRRRMGAWLLLHADEATGGADGRYRRAAARLAPPTVPVPCGGP